MTGRAYGGGATTAGPRAAGERRNVALLTVDSLRADHCGFMGAPWGTTPTMDDLATDGVVFKHAIAPGPRTPSSMPVAFTGRFPDPAPLAWEEWPARYQRISEHLQRFETLPERLQRAGYTTVGVTVNPWTHRTAFQKGFDEFVEVTGEVLTEDGRWRSPLVSLLDVLFKRTDFVEDHRWGFTKDWFVRWPHFYDRIIDSLDGVEEPYFLWVFSLDPHQPYLAGRRYREENSALAMYLANYREMTGAESEGALAAPVRERLRRAYRDAIRSVDGFVGELQADLPGRPALVVHSDHGDALGEHGNWGHPAALYEENLHVPLLVSGDDITPERVEAPISLRRLPELVAAVAAREDLDPARFTEDYVMATTETGAEAALRGHRWKYLEDGDATRLFDLSVDSEESIDRSDEVPAAVDGVRRLLGKRRHTNAELNGIGRAAEGLQVGQG